MNFCTLVNSGFDSHRFQYMQKAHTHRVNIRYIEENDYNVSKIELILNKANVYVFQRSFAPFMSLLFYAVKASGRLSNCYRKRIDLLNYTVLTKDERLVVTTMLLHNTTIRLF